MSLKQNSDDPIYWIEFDHELQLKLCDSLETIANGLPEYVDRQLANAVAEVLRTDFPMHMKLEEDLLFPLLRKRLNGNAQLAPMLDQLCEEHETDEAYGFELADELEALAEDGAPRNPNMLGYMLRGFFETQRRHVEWENVTVIPLARELLTPNDIDCLRDGAADRHMTADEERAKLIRMAIISDGAARNGSNN